MKQVRFTNKSDCKWRVVDKGLYRKKVEKESQWNGGQMSGRT